MTSLRTVEIAEAIDAGAKALFAGQRPDGEFDFSADGQASTLSTVGAVSALHFAHPGGSADLIAGGLDWLRRTQNEDGGWSMVPGDESEFLPTAVAAATMRFAKGDRDALAAARRRLSRYGDFAGLQREVAAWCRYFYSAAGWLDLADRERFPLELVLLPGTFRRRADFRAPTAAALALVPAHDSSKNPVRGLLDFAARPGALSIIRRVRDHGGTTGSWGEDAWLTGLICGALARAELAPDLVQSAANWFRATVNPDGSWNSGRPGLTWSAHAAGGLTAAGYADDVRLSAVKQLFRQTQQAAAFKVYDSPPGFWGSSGWPSTLETAEITSVLAGLPGQDQSPTVERGVHWLNERQSIRGAWGPCVRNTNACAHSTALAVDALLATGVPAADFRVAKAMRWLRAAQRADGSFDSAWFRPYTSGTSAVVQVLVKAGGTEQEAVRRAVRWLVRTQLADGSWSTGDGKSLGTVEETAWAVSALLSAGLGGESVSRGVAWLLDACGPDGWRPARVSEYVRHQCRYENRALANSLALRALTQYRPHAR